MIFLKSNLFSVLCASLLLSINLLSCQNDISESKVSLEEPGSLVFEMASSSVMAKLAALDSATIYRVRKAHVHLSPISSSAGSAIDTILNILWSPAGPISEKLSLPPGLYSLTQFGLSDSAGTLLFASPLQGSRDTLSVDNPLPLAFGVNSRATTRLVPEVIAVTRKNINSTGWVEFGFRVRETVPTDDVRIELVALVTSVSGTEPFMSALIVVGDTIKGYYKYQLGKTDDNTFLEVGDYRYNSAPYGIFLRLKTYSFSSSPSPNFLLEIVNNHNNRDNYLLRSYNNIYTGIPGTVTRTHISWQLDDTTRTALTNTNLTANPPILTNWQQNFALMIQGEYAASRNFTIRAKVIAVARVEP